MASDIYEKYNNIITKLVSLFYKQYSHLVKLTQVYDIFTQFTTLQVWIIGWQAWHMRPQDIGRQWHWNKEHNSTELWIWIWIRIWKSHCKHPHTNLIIVRLILFSLHSLSDYIFRGTYLWEPQTYMAATGNCRYQRNLLHKGGMRRGHSSGLHWLHVWRADWSGLPRPLPQDWTWIKNYKKFLSSILNRIWIFTFGL